MVAAAVIGSAVVGAGASAVAGSKAAKAQKKGVDQSVAEQRRQYDQTRADYAPWRAAGESALARLTNEMKEGATTAYTKSPSYDFRLSEGVKAAERSAAARGRLGSGATMKAVQRYGEGLASDDYSAWWNRNAGLAGVGQQATNATAAAGENMANNVSGAYQTAGNARASSYLTTGSAINRGLQGVAGAYLAQQGGGYGPNAYGVWSNGGGIY